MVADIVVLQDIADLPKIHAARDRAEEMDREWDLVTGPRLDAAERLEDLEERANGDEGTQAQRDLLVQLRKLFSEDATARQAEFTLLKARHDRDRALDTLTERFWHGN